MILILDGATDSQINAVREAYTAANPKNGVSVHQSFPFQYEKVLNHKNSLQIYGTAPEPTGDPAEDRYMSMYLSSQGVRYWGKNTDPKDPTYAGQLPTSGEEIALLIVDANYSEARNQIVASFGVQYTGSTYSEPRTFVILDAKRKINAHNPSDNPKVGSFLASLPDDVWRDTALVSTSSAKRLETLLTENDQTIPITTSTATSAKLKFAGLNYIETSLPSTPSREYGITLRSSVTLFERQY